MWSLSNWIRKSWTVRVVAGFTLAAAVLAASGWLVMGPGKGTAAGFDGTIRGAIRQMQSPMWTQLFLAFTKLGSTLYLWIVGAAAGIVFIIYRWFRPLALLMIVMAGQAGLHYGAKWLIARPRPAAMINYPTAEGLSFPSGHAIGGLCLYAMIAWAVSIRVESAGAKIGIWILAGLLILLIGVSRVYIGVHFPTDVLAGWLAAAIWTGAVMSLDRTDS